MLSQSSLPQMRVDDGPPWSNIGVDYAGPFFAVCKNSASNERIRESVHTSVYLCLDMSEAAEGVKDWSDHLMRASI